MQTARTEDAGPGDIQPTAAGIGGQHERGTQLVQLQPFWDIPAAVERDSNADHRGTDRTAPIGGNLGSESEAKMSRSEVTALVVVLRDGLNSALAEMHKRDLRIQRLRIAIGKLIEAR